MMKRLLALALGLGLAGCKVTSEPFCLEIEYGDCPASQAATTPAAPADSLRVVGFPLTRTNGAVGSLVVGDSVTLYLTRLATLDTVRAVAWEFASASGGVTITTRPDGGGTIKASAPGVISSVKTNGTVRMVFACNGLYCQPVTISVTRP